MCNCCFCKHETAYDMRISDWSSDVCSSDLLVPDKEAVFKEIFRVLKPAGHFSISDVVLHGDLPDVLLKEAEMYAGCVSGAIQKDTYLDLIHASGFVNVTVQKEKAISIPDDILGQYISSDEIAAFRSGNTGICSVTVYGEKPDGAQR